MMFEEKIQGLKNYVRRYPGENVSWERKKIQEEFPIEYAAFEIQEEKDELKTHIYRRANAIAHRIINPLGPNNRCYIPDCIQRGECYKEEPGELTQLLVEDIEKNLQLFHAKYPEEFRQFLQEEPTQDLHGSNEVQRKEYLQGMFVRIRKGYPDAKPEKPKRKEKVEKADSPVDPPEKREKPKRVKKLDKSVEKCEAKPKRKAKPTEKSETTPGEAEAKPETKPESKPESKSEKPKRKTKSDLEEKSTKKGISSTLKRLVWNRNIGEEIGKAKCSCCKSTDITQTSFHCGHVVAESKGGPTQVNNLKPICQNCNSSMGTRDMTDFMKTLE